MNIIFFRLFSRKWTAWNLTLSPIGDEIGIEDVLEWNIEKKVVSTMCYLHTHYVFTSNTIFICVYFSNADQGVYCTHSSESDFSVSVCFFSGISIFFLSAWSVELHMSNLMFLNCGVSILIWFSSIVYIMIVKFVHSKTENLTYIIVMKIEDWWLM